MRYLGLDLGTKTLGISLSDTSGTIASSLTTLRHDMDFNYLIEELKKITIEKNVGKIVLGFPKNMNNTVGERGQMVELFKSTIESNIDIPVVLEDERLTTRVAENILIHADMSIKKRKKVIDKVAANVILQGYLDRKEDKNGK